VFDTPPGDPATNHIFPDGMVPVTVTDDRPAMEHVRELAAPLLVSTIACVVVLGVLGKSAVATIPPPVDLIWHRHLLAEWE
jgi:hypothetical protein